MEHKCDTPPPKARGQVLVCKECGTLWEVIDAKEAPRFLLRDYKGLVWRGTRKGAS